MTHSHPIVDLHCDLLAYLRRSPKYTPYDLDVRCAIPQLRQGNVKLQVLAIFAPTDPGSTKRGWEQIELFSKLPEHYPADFTFVASKEQLDRLDEAKTIAILPAFEGASAFSEESEPLEQSFKRFDEMQKLLGKIAYVSLTWNGENRFGGGAYSSVGLKEDGRRLVDFLTERRIPIDFSHTSDYLAFDLFNHIEKHGLSTAVLASHSNLRKVYDVPRNLPDEIAKELIRRKALIGINFVTRIIGEVSSDYFSKQLDYLLQLGGERCGCFGADFFHDEDLPKAYRHASSPSFFTHYDNAGCYPRILQLWQQQLGLSTTTFQRICWQNSVDFFKNFL